MDWLPTDSMTPNLTIKSKFLLLFATLAIFGTVVGGVFINRTISRLLSEANTSIAVEIAKIEKERISSAFRTDINLTRLIARDATVLAWLNNEHSEILMLNAMAVIDRYASYSSSGRFFYIIEESKNYYTNSDGDQLVGSRYVYTVDTQDASSAWYNDSISASDEYVLNLDADEVVGDSVSIYVNYPVRVNSKVVALTGTSTPIRGFIDRYSKNSVVETRNIIVDAHGKVLIQNGTFYLDQGSALKENTESRSNFVENLMKKSDREDVIAAMNHLVKTSEEATSLMLTLNGEAWVVGITYITELDWYSLSLIPKAATPSQRTINVSFGVFMAIFIVVMFAIWLIMDRLVVRRIKLIHTDSIKMYKHSDIVGVKTEGDELLSLQNGMNEMQNKIHQQIAGLESKVKERTEELEEKNKELSESAIKDALTGLYNRRGLMERFILEYKRALRGNGLLGIVILDIDNFKKLNDTYGHHSGDLMLQAMAKAIKTRAEDIHVRWGGEEFVLIYTNVEEQQFATLLERLIENIHSAKVNIPGEVLSTTASVGGILMYPSQDTARDDQLILKALEQTISQTDVAMYEVKTSGKDNYKIVENK